MCGIVGYIGDRNGVDIVLEGISKIDYRGYDSAGIAAICKDKTLFIEKQKGEINQVAKLLPENLSSTNTIAHTRWATHGAPSKTNAHPHTDLEEKIAIVHNGVIENYQFLKNKLLDKGYSFYSQTDTEVLVKLIGYFYKKYGDFKEAFSSALKRVEGAYGIAAICTDEPKKLYAARLGSPLIIGVGDCESFVASDVAALVIHTKSVIYLEDHQLAVISPCDHKIETLEGEPIENQISKVDWDIPAIGKDGYEHFMLKEIFEQPTTVQNAFRGRVDKNRFSIVLDGLCLKPQQIREIEHIKFVACGTSWHAALVGKYLIESIARVPVVVEYASEFRYKNPVFPKKTALFSISQSGETADTLAAVRLAQQSGVPTFGITNVVGSTIARESKAGIYIHAGPEIGVASTKAFTSQAMIMALLALLFAKVRGEIAEGYINKFFEELDSLSDNIKRVFLLNDQIREIAAEVSGFHNALFLGRDVNFPVALEGALKLKEISYIHAEGYPAAEMKHGPIALIDENMPVIVIAPFDNVYPKTFSNLQEINARKGRLYVIATSKDRHLEEIAQKVLYIPQTVKLLSPIVSVVPLQLIAYYAALLKGLNIDKPRNLAKSVTVE